MFDELVCRACGCTDDRGCPGGCWWVHDDVCSQCATSVALIACSKRKSTGVQSQTPEELYQGSLLQMQLAYARQALRLPDEHIFILSAQYGLVPLSQEIRPYELMLSSLSASDREMWGFRVANQLVARIPGVVEAYLMAGRVYRTAVMPELEHWGIEIHVPHPEAYGIGQQLAWYKAMVTCPA